MKKRIAVVIVLSLLVLLTSCAKENDNHKSGMKLPSKENTGIANEIVETQNNNKGGGTTSKADASNKSDKDISSFIPVGWHILEQAEGDLNKDGINDIAVVIEEIMESEEVVPSRVLLIAFGNENNTYTLSIKAENAILKVDEGGIWGDPLEGISIDRGSLLITFYGGSNWRWYSTYRFRFQDDDWYLIGATLGSYFTGNATMDNADEQDYNLLTGDFIEKKADEKGIIKTVKGNRGIRNLLKLKDFIPYSEEMQF